MPLDPRIALGAAPPRPARSPLQTLGALARLNEEEQINQQRQLMNEGRRRELEDDDAIRETLQRTQNPDTAIDELYKAGRAQAAGSLSTKLYAQRKAASEEAERHVVSQKKAVDFAGQIAASATDQAGWDTAYPAMEAVLKPIAPELLAHIPKEYDPKVQQQLIDAGTSISDKLQAQDNAVKNAHKAMDIALAAHRDYDARQTALREAHKYWTASASNLLSTANNQQEWDTFQRMLANQIGQDQGPAVLAQFGNRYSPESVAKAKALGMTASEESSAAHAKVTERQGDENIGLRREEVDLRKQEAGAGGPSGRPLTTNRKSEIEEYKAREYDKIEKDLLDEFGQVSGGTKVDEAGKKRYGQRKLRVEDNARKMAGLPPLLDTEHEAASKGDAASLSKIRKVYRNLAGEDTPLEQMEKIAADLKKESNPTKATALRRQLADLRKTYGELVGR